MLSSSQYSDKQCVTPDVSILEMLSVSNSGTPNEEKNSGIPNEEKTSNVKQAKQEKQKVALTQSRKEKDARGKEATRQQVNKIKHVFKHDIQPRKVKYTCERCGEKRVTFVLRQVGNKVGRTCLDNIDGSYMINCTFKKDALSREYHRQYTNLDMLYEYTTAFELKYVPWLPDWWHKKSIISVTESSKLQQIRSNLNQLSEMLHKLLKLKQELFETKCDIKNVNMSVLRCFQDRIDYYLKVIDFFGKFNKYVWYRDFQCPEWGYCHGCNNRVYLKTQYERIYVAIAARLKMNQVEFMNDQENKFVCQFCIGQLMNRAQLAYSHFDGKSLMYVKPWNDLDYHSQLVFIFGHLNHGRLPIHVSWYDVNHGAFRRGKLLDVGDKRQLLVKVEVDDAKDERDRIQWIPLKSYDIHSFFVYQKPSTSWSHEYTRNDCNGFDKFWFEENCLVDTTSPDYASSFLPVLVLDPKTNIINRNWNLPIVHKGFAAMRQFMHVFHMKCVYDELKKNGLLYHAYDKIDVKKFGQALKNQANKPFVKDLYN